MKRLPIPALVPLALLFLLFLVSVRPVRAQATLENPRPGSFQSGISVISGWACDAERIEIEFDGGLPVAAAYGTDRGDTRDRCGDTDNGFGLLFNWNRLGDGSHTIRALADGVEFARVAVTVTTFGENFLRDASGEYTVSNFPHVGDTTRVQWAESLQNFVITDGSAPGGGGHASVAGVNARLENPALGSFQSGIAAISGWACEADEIVIELNGVPYRAGYPTTRTDTQDRCGDSDNGFSLLWNWNNLGPGTHTVRALLDGQEFATTTVRVTTFGEQVLRGVSGTFPLADFPQAGDTTRIRWAESLQNFVISEIIWHTDDHGNTLSDATIVDINSDTAGMLEDEHDIDYFWFDVGRERGSLVVETTGGTDTKGTLELLTGVTYRKNDDCEPSGAKNRNFCFRTYGIGQYWVRVEGSGLQSIGSYTLHIRYKNAPYDQLPEPQIPVPSEMGYAIYIGGASWSWRATPDCIEIIPARSEGLAHNRVVFIDPGMDSCPREPRLITAWTGERCIAVTAQDPKDRFERRRYFFSYEPDIEGLDEARRRSQLRCEADFGLTAGCKLVWSRCVP